MSQQKTTREEIVKAASQLLAEESISHFTISAVCERAGLSRRSFFNYFPSKDDLMTEVLKSLRAAHYASMQELSAELPDDLSVEARIIAIFRRILDIIRVPNWRGSAFIRLSSELSDLDNHPIHRIVAESKLDQEKWFEQELQRGSFASPALLATQLTILMTGLFELQLVHRSPRHGDAVLSLIPHLLASGRSLPR